MPTLWEVALFIAYRQRVPCHYSDTSQVHRVIYDHE